MKYLPTKAVTVTTLALGVSLCGLSGYIIYNLLKKRNDDTSSNSNELIVRIPKSRIGLIVGRNGVKIRELESKSNTRISFDDEIPDSKEQICRIEGKPESCQYASRLIKDIISNEIVMEVEDLWIAQSAAPKVLGRCGEVAMKIMNSSGAFVKVCADTGDEKRKVTLKGTKEQINIAKEYINEILKEHNSALQALPKREPRIPSSKSSEKLLDSPKSEKITDTNPFEVYVSAMMDPSRFWVQIVGPKATELDQLVEEMTEYYKTEQNRELHLLEKVQVGDLVAATFQYDKKWYRAEVLNLTDGTEPQAELYYVDYGDTDTVNCRDLYELRTDFLRLHFQAIECYLAKVEPVGDSWPEEAIDKFEEWTHVAQWQKLSARYHGYSVRERTRAKREGSPVPGVELFDAAAGDRSIADELVKGGYAVYKKENSSARSSRATSMSNVSMDSA